MPKLTSIETIVVGDGRCRWNLVRVAGDDGVAGWGEGSDCQAVAWEHAVHDVFARRLLGEEALPVPTRQRLGTRGASRLSGAADGFVLRTAASSIEQAVWDLHARSMGVSLATALGGALTDRVRIYANLNRGLTGTSPEDLARAGAEAVAAGFDAVKCAPFRELDAHDPSCDVRVVADAGLARVAALCDAVPSAVVHVDAHGRLNLASAPAIAAALAEFGVGWLEDPLGGEVPVGLEAVKAAAPTLPVAGGELLAGWDPYDRLLQTPVDVVLTDIKHCGGHGALAETAALCRARNRQLSLHNPAGPVAALHSAHAAATQPGCFPLEHAYSADRAARAERLIGDREPTSNGWLLLPDATGIGIDPDEGDLIAEGTWRRSEL